MISLQPANQTRLQKIRVSCFFSGPVGFIKTAREEFIKTQIWMTLVSRKVPDSSNYSLCEQCDVACADCSAPGNASCHFCAEGYTRDEASPNLGPCRKAKPLGNPNGGRPGGFHSPVLAVVVSVCGVAVTVVVGLLLLRQVGRLL